MSIEQLYRLPDGRIVTKKTYYEFLEVIRSDLKSRGFCLYGYDPGISFYDINDKRQHLENITVDAYSKLVGKDFYKECGL